MIKIGNNYIAPEDVSAELLKKMKEYAEVDQIHSNILKETI
mgnify:CR=1 FL=1